MRKSITGERPVRAADKLCRGPLDVPPTEIDVMLTHEGRFQEWNAMDDNEDDSNLGHRTRWYKVKHEWPNEMEAAANF